MTYIHQHKTAKIYQFPVKPGVSATSTGANSALPQLCEPSRAALTAMDAWYHDEAISEADRVKNS